MTDVVVDASVVLAFLRGEPFHERTAEILVGAAISAVNVAEVAAKLVDFGTPEERASEFAVRLDLEVVPFGMSDAHGSAALRAATKSAGLSLGDRACLALADRLGRVAWTADRGWQELDTGVAVELIR